MHMSDRMNPLFVVVRHRTHMRRDVAILLNLTFKFFVNFLSRSVRIDSLLCDYNFWVCALHFDCLRDSKEKSRARMCVCVLFVHLCMREFNWTSASKIGIYGWLWCCCCCMFFEYIKKMIEPVSCRPTQRNPNTYARTLTLL